MIKIERTSISEVFTTRAEPIQDHRGHFVRTYCADEFAEAGIRTSFVQVNGQFSSRIGTLRGLHLQTGDSAEIKFVRCTRGRVWDVAVDLRPNSPTYLDHVSVELSASNRMGIVVAAGCAHGFVTLEPDSEVEYLTDRRFAPAMATGVRFDDPALAIPWPVAIDVISERDASWEAIRV